VRLIVTFLREEEVGYFSFIVDRTI